MNQENQNDNLARFKWREDGSRDDVSTAACVLILGGFVAGILLTAVCGVIF